MAAMRLLSWHAPGFAGLSMSISLFHRHKSPPECLHRLPGAYFAGVIDGLYVAIIGDDAAEMRLFALPCHANSLLPWLAGYRHYFADLIASRPLSAARVLLRVFLTGDWLF